MFQQTNNIDIYSIRFNRIKYDSLCCVIEASILYIYITLGNCISMLISETVYILLHSLKSEFVLSKYYINFHRSANNYSRSVL